MPRPTLEQLVRVPDPAWPLVQSWIAVADVPVEVLPASDDARNDTLLAMRVTVRSPMGAIAFETGGIRVDDGWLMILGSGHPRVPWSPVTFTRELGWWNHLDDAPPLLVVACDVLGGLFALDGGALGAPGKVHYFAPDSLRWENLDLTYSAFVTWCMSARIATFYESERWQGWRDDVRVLAGGDGIGIYPPLWAKESKPIDKTQRGPSPLLAIVRLSFEFQRQLDGATK